MRGALQARTSNPRRFWTVLFVAWLFIVWGHSLMSGDISSFESSRFVFLVRPIFALFGINDEQLMTFVIRKGAHFSEYAILVVLGNQMARAWFSNTWRAALLTFAIWVIAPCVDEFIQTQTPGRSGMLRDVLIDMAGGMFGFLVLTFVRWWRARKHEYGEGTE